MAKLYYTKNKDEIIEKVYKSSIKLSNHLKKKEGDFFMTSKYITHSDLYSGGKRTSKKDGFDKNILYYLEIEDMKKLSKMDEESINRSAKQTSIRVSSEFYNFINISEKGTIGPIGFKIFLVKDKLEYFDKKNTELVIKNLKKSYHNTSFIDIDKYKKNNLLIELDKINTVKHGIITESDSLLWKLRKSVFKGDILNIIVVKTDKITEIYLFFERNSVFYKITDKQKELFKNISITKEYLKYLRNRETSTVDWIPKFNKKTRYYQEYWKKLLLDELIIYHEFDPREEGDIDYQIKCPISGIEISTSYASSIMIASHIKSFKDSNDQDVYDLNNGILMISHYDALFDKHLISVDSKNRVVFSSNVNKTALSRTLNHRRHNSKVYNEYLFNDNRKKYLEFHYNKFTEKQK